jgi:MFS family permease
VSATWAARIPAIQEELGLTAGTLALAVLGLEAGALAGLPAGGAAVARWGSRAVLRLGFGAYPLALTAVAVAPGLAALAAALAAMAFANSLVDVAINVRGVELERRAGGARLSRLHAGHAVGVLAGGLVGTAAAAASVAVAVHFTIVAVIVLAGGQAAAMTCGDERGDASAGRAGRGDHARAPLRGAPVARLERPLALLGAVAFCAFLLDGVAYAWIAVHLRGEGASPGLAAAGFTVFALALAVGRLGGDRLIERRGRAGVVRGGSALAVGGIGLALAAPPPLALAGWAALGAGLAPIAPAVLGAAAGASRLPAPHAIARVTAVGYLGSFSGPPLIGALAGPLGLGAALGVMGAAAITAGLLARPALRTDRSTRPPGPGATGAPRPSARPRAAPGGPATRRARPGRAPESSPRRR